MGADRVFVDTNVLVYAADAASPFHAMARLRLQDYADRGYEIWVSRQIFREYLVVMSRLLKEAGQYNPTALVGDVRRFESQFYVAEESDLVTKELLSLIETHAVSGKAIHDCNLVALMKTYGLTELLTLNTADFSRYQHDIQVVALQ
jgi:predicted nucleic acid-binding protein